MAVPVVQGSTVSSGAVSSNHTIGLPAGIVAGDALLIFGGYRASVTAVSSGLVGWSSIAPVASTDLGRCFVKIATGGEGTSTTAQYSSGAQAIYVAYRVNGNTADLPEGAAVQGSTATADPPSVSPSWGSTDHLFFASFTSTAAPTTKPTGYASSVFGYLTTHGLIVMDKDVSGAASDDPSSYVKSTGVGARHISYTVAVRGSTVVAAAALAAPTWYGGGAVSPMVWCR